MYNLASPKSTAYGFSRDKFGMTLDLLKVSCKLIVHI